jgi:hypothetical protein
MLFRGKHMIKIKEWFNAIVTFLQKYPAQTHAAIVIWNAFVISWATKVSVPLQSIGIPLVVNATAAVDWMQLHLHCSTSIVVVVTFLVNISTAYISWKKAHIQTVQVPAGSVLIAESPTGATLGAIAKKDDVKLK